MKENMKKRRRKKGKCEDEGKMESRRVKYVPKGRNVGKKGA